VLLSALTLAGGPIGPQRFRFDPEKSDFGSLARRHNLLHRVDPEAAQRLERLIEVLRSPGRLEGDADGRRLLQDPRFRSLAEPGADQAARRALVESLAEDPELRPLLDRLLERAAARE
jgi:hypothetical protein